MLPAAGVASAQAQKEAQAPKQTTSQRMTHHRAIDAAVWAMPLVETYNLSMMRLLAKIGIRKGEPFKPSPETAGDTRQGRAGSFGIHD
jgi:hypothetical protein